MRFQVLLYIFFYYEDRVMLNLFKSQSDCFTPVAVLTHKKKTHGPCNQNPWKVNNHLDGKYNK